MSGWVHTCDEHDGTCELCDEPVRHFLSRVNDQPKEFDVHDYMGEMMRKREARYAR